jgi:exopolysaccharide production protein ExoY
MTGPLIVGSRSSLRPDYARGAFDAPGSWEGSQVTSIVTLLRRDAQSAYAPNRQADAPNKVSEWEQLSLAIHKLRTHGFQYWLLKRLLDIFVVCALLPCLLPLSLIVAAVVWISSTGPILYRQTRVGRFGREFSLWKFRTMYADGDALLREHLQANPGAATEWATSHKLAVDPRITRLGRLLRRTSLDELPQFLNVMIGNMSLVGPRPIVPHEKVKYRDSYFFYASAKPGLSGLWQVSGRSHLPYDRRIALDEEYVRRWNMALDIEILWRTAGAVWRSEGAF